VWLNQHLACHEFVDGRGSVDLVLVSCILDSLDNGFISCMDFDALVYNPRPLGMRFSL
jgi:hypothetical protein